MSRVAEHTARGPLLVDVVELTPTLRDDAVRVLAEAFLDDPAWVAIGPDRKPARLRLLLGYYEVLTGEALRWGGPHYCAVSDREVVGVALTYAEGAQFPPPRATLREAPPFIRSGPGPGLRAAYVDYVMKRAHPRDEHLLLWYLAAHPDFQRRGVGRALLLKVLGEAEDRGLPIYLDTTRLENVSYYESYGFRSTGEARLPRRARVWFMRREHRRAASAPDLEEHGNIHGRRG